LRDATQVVEGVGCGIAFDVSYCCYAKKIVGELVVYAKRCFADYSVCYVVGVVDYPTANDAFLSYASESVAFYKGDYGLCVRV